MRGHSTKELGTCSKLNNSKPIVMPAIPESSSIGPEERKVEAGLRSGGNVLNKAVANSWVTGDNIKTFKTGRKPDGRGIGEED
jgi:hypothetical protein